MTFTTDVVTETLHRIVADKGADYVYPNAGGTCRYSEPDGSPSCIVGHVVAALEPEAFAKTVELEAETGDTTDARNYLAGWQTAYDWDRNYYQYETPRLVDYESTLAEALELAQRAQDGGLTWGQAVEYFDRHIVGGERFFDLCDEIRRATEALAGEAE